MYVSFFRVLLIIVLCQITFDSRLIPISIPRDTTAQPKSRHTHWPTSRKLLEMQSSGWADSRAGRSTAGLSATDSPQVYLREYHEDATEETRFHWGCRRTRRRHRPSCAPRRRWRFTARRLRRDRSRTWTKR